MTPPVINNEEQQFLSDLDKKLWNAADRLRSNLDAAVYKHAVLGLIFLKYVSDAFDIRREELRQAFSNPKSDYYLDPADYKSDKAYQKAIEDELEDRDYYTEKNVFWVPALARWSNISENCTLPANTKITIKNGKKHTYEFRSVGRLLDDALEAIETDNPKLKGIIEKNRYAQLQLEASKLIGLISEVVSSIPFHHKSLSSKDILGHVYEYFLGQFALAEGKKGGQYYTPKSIVSVIVEMIEPYKGKVYDPAMGSGGFFVQSEQFIEEYGGKIGNISVYGQESNPTTWRLAAMNMAIRGIDFDFGKRPTDSFTNDLHPDLRADYIMANPPFNDNEWWDAKLEQDPRWQYGTPPKGNANFAWLQHMLYHLSDKGTMALLLSNGSMSSNTSGEGDIRKNLIENDLVECMLALPGQLFTNTQIPACVWVLTKNKKPSKPSPSRGEGKGGGALADRTGKTLFIDARKLGYLKDRVLRDFTTEDMEKIAGTFHKWRQSPSPSGRSGDEGRVYEDEAGFCYSASLDDIRKADYVLTPGRYVGAAEVEGDGEPFAEKMQRLTAQLYEQFEESDALEERIKKNIEELGFHFAN